MTDCHAGRDMRRAPGAVPNARRDRCHAARLDRLFDLRAAVRARASAFTARRAFRRTAAILIVSRCSRMPGDPLRPSRRPAGPGPGAAADWAASCESGHPGRALARVTMGSKPGEQATAGVLFGGGEPASAGRSAVSTVGAMTASTMAPAVRTRRVDGRDSSASVFGPGHSRESHWCLCRTRGERQWEPGQHWYFRRPCQHIIALRMGRIRIFNPAIRRVDPRLSIRSPVVV